MTLTALVLLASVGLLVALLGLPLLAGWVKPNRVYGFRTPRTVADREVWYPANRMMAQSLVIGGLLGALAAMIGGLMWGDAALTAATIGLVAPLLVSITVGFIRASAYVGDLDAGRIPGDADPLPRERPEGTASSDRSREGRQADRD